MIAGLAPMAGYTDYWFREMCRKRGARLTCTEMVSAEALARGNEHTKQLLRAREDEVTQLFGANPESLRKACEFVETGWVNLNAGCPARDITSSGAGAALLKDLPQLKECIQALKRRKVGVKIRLGWTTNNAVEIAGACEDAGAQRITVHGRTAKQGFSGEANWEAVKNVSEAVSIPVFGNGDVSNLEDGKKRAVEAGCTGFLVGRAAMGWPGFFDGSGLREKISDFSWYAEKQENFSRLKQQAIAFARGFKGAKALRQATCQAKNKEELIGLFVNGNCF